MGGACHALYCTIFLSKVFKSIKMMKIVKDVSIEFIIFNLFVESLDLTTHRLCKVAHRSSLLKKL